MSRPQAKKAKLQTDTEWVLEKISDKLNPYFCIHMGFCNGFVSCDFSNAFVEQPQFTTPIERLKDNTNDRSLATKVSTLGKLLKDAGAFLGEEKETLTQNQTEAVLCLEKYLQEYKTHQDAIMRVKENLRTDQSDVKSKVCAVLAAHLFSKLVHNGDTVVNKTILTLPSSSCPCGCYDDILIGDTGIGVASAWHGFPDLLVDYTPVVVFESTKDTTTSENDEENDACCSMEGKRHRDLYNIDHNSQLIAQTVTNSFAQKFEFRLGEHNLVPSIGCTLEDIMIYAYDLDKDILLRRLYVLPLIVDGRISLPAIAELWFILNISVIGAKLNESAVLNKSGFREMLIENHCLELYEKATLKESKFLADIPKASGDKLIYKELLEWS